MPTRRKPITPAGQSLRRSPWVVAAIVAVALLARVATGTTSAAWWSLLILLGVATALIVSWHWRLDSQAQREGERLHAFASSSAAQLTMLKRVPQFKEDLKHIRGFLFGWPVGRVIVDSEGVSWVPNSGTQRFLHVPSLHLDWSQIAEAAVVNQLGPGTKGILDLRLANGADCAFMISRRRELATFLDRLPIERAPAAVEAI